MYIRLFRKRMRSGTSTTTAQWVDPSHPCSVFGISRLSAQRWTETIIHTKKNKGTAWRLRDPESHCKQLVPVDACVALRRTAHGIVWVPQQSVLLILLLYYSIDIILVVLLYAEDYRDVVVVVLSIL